MAARLPLRRLSRTPLQPPTPGSQGFGRPAGSLPQPAAGGTHVTHVKRASPQRIHLTPRRRWNISVSEERELALHRLRALCHSGNFSITDFRTNPLRIFAAHEVAAFCDVSMATKMTVQYNRE